MNTELDSTDAVRDQAIVSADRIVRTSLVRECFIRAARQTDSMKRLRLEMDLKFTFIEAETQVAWERFLVGFRCCERVIRALGGGMTNAELDSILSGSR